MKEKAAHRALSIRSGTKTKTRKKQICGRHLSGVDQETAQQICAVRLMECVTAKPSGKRLPFCRKEGFMKVCEKERKEGNQLYVEGLKRYQKRGIRVLIDGEDASDATWDKLFEVREDGSFYMGDYILEDIPQDNSAANPAVEGVNEEEADYMKTKRLKEIHFDMVYHR